MQPCDAPYDECQCPHQRSFGKSLSGQQCSTLCPALRLTLKKGPLQYFPLQQNVSTVGSLTGAKPCKLSDARFHCIPIVQARAVLYMGYLQQPTVLELTVGPLPSPSNYTILREVPWNTRPPNSVEYAT